MKILGVLLGALILGLIITFAPLVLLTNFPPQLDEWVLLLLDILALGWTVAAGGGLLVGLWIVIQGIDWSNLNAVDGIDALSVD